ncbi:F-box/kelch-repeat protein SKIP25 [Manihot esculenta]|uniref:F-box domain-containing protein n=1 Tax=Manihot esculenta TaxID=3983 RepID=A0A2C9W1P3_MANES|nr:F-box/kelch-repeat protein SKIP25 [Manihot esculenta]
MANPIDVPTNTNAVKRQGLTHNHRTQEVSDLISGLPDHIAQLCLSFVQPSLLFSVCSSWRRLIYSPDFPPFLSLYTVLSSNQTDHSEHSNSIQFFNFDPISSRWDSLPPPPPDPPLRLLLRHPSFISRHLPIQLVSVSGNLVLLAATTYNFFPALSRPLIFNPVSRTWAFGPPLSTPRRWCAAGTVNDTIYVASGIGSNFSADVAKSVEKWDFLLYLSTRNKGNSWKWEKVKGLKNGRFSRDAIDAVGWRGKLCMVNAKGDAAKEGSVYDTEKDAWEDMPEGMLSGWKGPAAAMDEKVMYMVDEGKGALKKYDPERDDWEIIMESERLVGAQQITAGGGRVCVVCGRRNSGGIVVVDVVAMPVKLWVVETPPGFEAVTVHILPRMSQLPP